ncbi:hypothetical protein E2C01_069716 [Portunus trituberculatus]|uniref:Uncharacterized protein n=1 Tax=Portunus trituberculatus TaxID=210409 RepID=A0A5B7HSA3_PORTR|nr:hypothetical protein [Portunus trituberculatus]
MNTISLQKRQNCGTKMVEAATVRIIVMMMAIMGVIESNPMPNSMDHGFPNAHTNTTTTTTHARHGHLLHGMLGNVDSYVFDDVVEFLFQQLGEELPQARSHYDGEDYYPLPSEYSMRRDTDVLYSHHEIHRQQHHLPKHIHRSVRRWSGSPTAVPLLCVNRDDLVRENGERSNLDVDVNLDEDGNSDDDLRATEARKNEQNRKGNSRFKVTIKGEDQEDENGDGTYTYERRGILRKQTQEQNKEETNTETLDQDDMQEPKDKEGGRNFTMHISNDSFIGRLLSWGNWGLSLPSLRYNTNICPMLGRYIQR